MSKPVEHEKTLELPPDIAAELCFPNESGYPRTRPGNARAVIKALKR